MLALLAPYRGKILLLLALGLVGNLTGLLLPKLIGEGINSFAVERALSPVLFQQFLAAVIAVAVLSSLQSVVEVFTSERVARDLRERLSHKLSRQTYSFVVENDPSRLLTNLTSDVEAIKFFVSQAIAGIISSVAVLLGASGFLLYLNFRLGLAILAILPLIALTFGFVFSRVRKLFKEGRLIIDRLNRVVGESIVGAAIVRVLDKAEAEKEKFSTINRRARDLGLTILKHFASMIPVVTFLASFGTFIILTLGGKLVLSEEMDLGTLAAFNSYLGMLIFPIIVLGFMGNLIAQAQASFARLQKILDTPDPPLTGQVKESLKGAVEVEGLRFSYGEKEVLKGITLRLEPGSRNAVVGPTAAGKSQLIHLLCGLLEPKSGSVLYDGKYKPEELRHQVSVVFQESFLSEGTLRDNIAFFPEVTPDGWDRAVETAELEDFISGLALKEETLVSERGTTLSGGQKQRVMLARALAMEPDVLLLDDFTARLDPATEAKVLSNLQRNFPHLTLLVVSQRIAPVEHYDRIFLMMEGALLAQGTHLELLESSPEYCQIYDSQKSTQQYE